MRPGRRWIVLDADFFANHLTDRILDRFGPAGVCLFVALLCAAKRSRVQGQITYASDAEAFDILGLRNIQLVDSAGDKWTLDDFWKFTGTQKQTRRSTHGHVKNVKVTGWSQWQETLTREMAADRMRRLRAESARTDTEQEAHADRTTNAHDSDLDLDHENDKGKFASRNGKTQPTGRPVADWKPEPKPDGPLVAGAQVANLRANPGADRP